VRVVVVGATGVIGSAVAELLRARHEVIPASRHSAHPVDITDSGSIERLYRGLGPVDAVVATAGDGRFGALADLTEEDFRFSLHSKLMGQVNLIRIGATCLADGGSFTVTTGVLASRPVPGSAAYTMVNAGLEGFVRAAALELPRGLRVNVVSPGWISETLVAMGRDPAEGTPAREVAQAYRASVEGRATGTIIHIPPL
jgi:NAD(P)-dependent dehydrogenase (short-subunit alcohol dehydrogenase family)